MSWYWRTKPRSIIKTIQWFPCFGALEGKNWNESISEVSAFNQKKIYPTRRSYIYYAHGEDDNWLSNISYDTYLSGTEDQKETESNGRNDKSTYEFFGFGYVDKDGTICVTPCGRSIMQNRFDQEQYLIQLLKLHLPNPIQKIKSNCKSPSVFPLQLVLLAFSHYDYLSRGELALLFGCDHPSLQGTMLEAIQAFREGYEQLPNKLDLKANRELFSRIYETYYGKMENKAESYYDYAEAFSRSLAYTGLFSLSGRSIFTKVRVQPHARKKVSLLQNNFTFSYPNDFSSLSAYMDWYGSTSNLTLPWENIKERKELLQEKINYLQSLVTERATTHCEQTSFGSQKDLDLLLLQTSVPDSVIELKQIEKTVDTAIINHTEEYYIQVTSKTSAERKCILEKFDDILSNDDMSALWLEVNTWKSLLSIPGFHQVKRNFNVEEDLTPRSFAPGVGNTPDMELYHKDIILLPEVSLMTGVRQWEHEASSVVDHVMHFIEKDCAKNIFGLFLSSKIHPRTLWQFFILTKESWLGTPIPVLPLTIQQYVCIISHCYNKNTTIDTFLDFLQYLLTLAKQEAHPNAWETAIENAITKFVQT